MSRKTPVSAVSLNTSTRDDLNRLVLEVSVSVGKRLSVSTVVAGMLAVVGEHRDELIAALTPSTEDPK